MAMGSESKVVLDSEMQKAKQDCQTFRSDVSTLMQELESAVNTLLASGFKGEAANGFQDFYKNNIVAFFAQGGSFDQFIGMFDKDGEGLFDIIEKTLVGGEGLQNLNASAAKAMILILSLRSQQSQELAEL